MSEVKRGLGRGLSALLGDIAQEEPIASDAARPAGLRTIPVGDIQPNPSQPRHHFDEAALDELAASVAARGLIQPIVVRPRGKGYEIVAGERRWRAAQRAQLHEIPAIVRELDDEATFEVAIIENVQRADLNAIEEAEAYQRLITDFGHNQGALAQLVNKSRSHVANIIRLLDLPPSVREMVAEGRLTMGHARALIGTADPEVLAQNVISRGLNVRQTEALAKGPAKPRAPQASPSSGASADIEALERQISDLLGLKVAIAHGGKGGTITINYATLDQLDMVCQRLSGGEI